MNGARAKLWELGVIAPWYLFDFQYPIYEFMRLTRDPFCEMTRRFGKTTTTLVREQEDLRQAEGWITLWCEPWKEQARNIVIREMERIQESCPTRLKAKFYRTDSFFEVPQTGSRIYLVGVNEDKGEAARGRTANRIVLDEHGSYREAEYIENEVFRPMLLTTGGEMVKIGTPPDDLGHFYYTAKAQAVQEGRFIQRTIDHVTTISDEEKGRFILAMGGANSPAVRRELYCEPVSDPERLVIPEYNPSLHDVEDDYERPPFYDGYVGIDLGLSDCNAGLFAYVDFLKRELVIDSEYVANGKNTAELVSAFRVQEKLSFGTETCRCDLFAPVVGPKLCLQHGPQPWLRVGDNEAQQLYDMQSLHGYTVVATRKDDKLAALNELRLLFGEGRIKIKKRCESLRYQLKVGLWNERRTDFQRGDKTGHLDAIDALIYLARNVNWTRNPYPQNVGVSLYTHFAPDLTISQAASTDRALEESLGALLGDAIGG